MLRLEAVSKSSELYEYDSLSQLCKYNSWNFSNFSQACIFIHKQCGESMLYSGLPYNAWDLKDDL